jgi:hypothetical protein
MWELGGVVKPRKRTEKRLVLALVFEKNLLGGVEPRAVHFDDRFDRYERLIVEGVPASVPHEQLCLTDV